MRDTKIATSRARLERGLCVERIRLMVAWSEAINELGPLAKVLSEGELREQNSFLEAWCRLKDAAETSARLYKALAIHVNKHECLSPSHREFEHRLPQHGRVHVGA